MLIDIGQIIRIAVLFFIYPQATLLALTRIQLLVAGEL